MLRNNDSIGSLRDVTKEKTAERLKEQAVAFLNEAVNHKISSTSYSMVERKSKDVEISDEDYAIKRSIQFLEAKIVHFNSIIYQINKIKKGACDDKDFEMKSANSAIFYLLDIIQQIDPLNNLNVRDYQAQSFSFASLLSFSPTLDILGQDTLWPFITGEIIPYMKSGFKQYVLSKKGDLTKKMTSDFDMSGKIATWAKSLPSSFLENFNKSFVPYFTDYIERYNPSELDESLIDVLGDKDGDLVFGKTRDVMKKKNDVIKKRDERQLLMNSLLKQLKEQDPSLMKIIDEINPILQKTSAGLESILNDVENHKNKGDEERFISLFEDGESKKVNTDKLQNEITDMIDGIFSVKVRDEFTSRNEKIKNIMQLPNSRLAFTLGLTDYLRNMKFSSKVGVGITALGVGTASLLAIPVTAVVGATGLATAAAVSSAQILKSKISKQAKKGDKLINAKIYGSDLVLSTTDDENLRKKEQTVIAERLREHALVHLKDVLSYDVSANSADSSKLSDEEYAKLRNSKFIQSKIDHFNNIIYEINRMEKGDYKEEDFKRESANPGVFHLLDIMQKIDPLTDLSIKDYRTESFSWISLLSLSPDEDILNEHTVINSILAELYSVGQGVFGQYVASKDEALNNALSAAISKVKDNILNNKLFFLKVAGTNIVTNVRDKVWDIISPFLKEGDSDNLYDQIRNISLKMLKGSVQGSIDFVYDTKDALKEAVSLMMKSGDGESRGKSIEEIRKERERVKIEEKKILMDGLLEQLKNRKSSLRNEVSSIIPILRAVSFGLETILEDVNNGKYVILSTDGNLKTINTEKLSDKITSVIDGIVGIEGKSLSIKRKLRMNKIESLPTSRLSLALGLADYMKSMKLSSKIIAGSVVSGVAISAVLGAPLIIGSSGIGLVTTKSIDSIRSLRKSSIRKIKQASKKVKDEFDDQNKKLKARGVGQYITPLKKIKSLKEKIMMKDIIYTSSTVSPNKRSRIDVGKSIYNFEEIIDRNDEVKHHFYRIFLNKNDKFSRLLFKRFIEDFFVAGFSNEKYKGKINDVLNGLFEQCDLLEEDYNENDSLDLLVNYVKNFSIKLAEILYDATEENKILENSQLDGLSQKLELICTEFGEELTKDLRKVFISDYIFEVFFHEFRDEVLLQEKDDASSLSSNSKLSNIQVSEIFSQKKRK